MRPSRLAALLAVVLMTTVSAHAQMEGGDPLGPVPPVAGGAAGDVPVRRTLGETLNRTREMTGAAVGDLRTRTGAMIDGTRNAAGEAVNKTRGKIASVNVREMLRQASPRHLYRTAAQNYRDGRFYATDLTEHATWRAALRQSLAPTDMSANVRAAFLSKVHPARIAGNLFDPLSIELTRQLASGEGINVKRLVTSLHPAVIGATMAGGAAGDIAGAVIQSTLARFGPVGATVGFFARPMLGYGAQILGMNVGEGLASGKSLSTSMADSLRNIKPGRDLGQLMGGVIGGTLGQVFIPIPLVGGIIGGTVGGLLGGIIGNALSKAPGLEGVNAAMVRALNRWADKLEGKAGPDTGPAAAGASATTTASTTPAPSTTSTSSTTPSSAEFVGPPAPVRPRPAPGPTPVPPPGAGETRSDEPSMDDLPIVER